MTKTEIIKAAFRVWGRDFYRKPSLSSLAGELGVSKPALYRHFKSKQVLTAAMTGFFFDEFAASIKEDFEQALLKADIDDGIFTIVCSISGFYAKNVYALIFSLINLYDRNTDRGALLQQISERGVNMKIIRLVIEKKYEVPPPVINLMFATLTFYMSIFHKANDSFNKNPTDEQVNSIVSTIYKVIKHGLDLSCESIEALDFKKLEKMIDGTMHCEEPQPLFKAVAEAVAEAGPWDTTMDMVAKRMGLSKSSLYGHFKNRNDMLRRLFLTEFKRIIEFARQGIKLSANTAEQLYLGLYSIVFYFRLRPEIIVAIGWIRTRKLDLGNPDIYIERPDLTTGESCDQDTLNTFNIFKDVYIESIQNTSDEEKQQVYHWILFLLVNVLMHKNLPSENVRNKDIRLLYKFVASGLGGFKR